MEELRKITTEELNEILEKHKIYLNKSCEDWKNYRADLSYVDLKGVNLENVNLAYANLNDANLEKANLKNANFNYASFIHANLNGTDLKDANLKNANLNYTSFIRANLACVDFEKAKLNSANFEHANLIKANLNKTSLRNTNFNHSNLNGANLSEADLNNAYINCYDLINVNFSGAILKDITLKEANLSGSTGLLNPIDYIKENFECTDKGIIAYKSFEEFHSSPENWEIKSGSIITESVNYNRSELDGCGINVAPYNWVKKTCINDIWKVLIRWEWAVDIVVPYNTNGQIRCGKAELLEIVK